jgi:hypothetical protein
MAGSVRGQRTHVHVMGALGIGDQDDLALTRHNLLHVGDGLLEHSVMGRDDTVSEPNFAPLFSLEWVDQRGCDRLMPENAHNSAHANGGLLCRGLKSCPEDDLLAVNAAQGTAKVSLLISHHSCLSWTLV